MGEKRVSDHVVNTLARLTAEAKAGNIAALAVVTVSPGGDPAVNFGGSRDMIPEVYLGAGLLQATIMEQVLVAPDAKKMHSGVIMPGERLQS